jgi:hypothetical protein
MERERETVGGSRADQRRAADLHGAYGMRGFVHARQGNDPPLAGQTSLIDDLDGASGKRRAQGLDVGRFHKLLDVVGTPQWPSRPSLAWRSRAGLRSGVKPLAGRRPSQFLSQPHARLLRDHIAPEG